MRIFTTISQTAILSGKELRFLRYGLLRNPPVEMTVGGEPCNPSVEMTVGDERRRLAFTLIELLTVVAIIALMASAVGGLYGRSYQRQVIEKNARELVLTAKYARVIAIEHQQPCKLNLDPKAGRFFLTITVWDEQSNQFRQQVIQNQYCKPTDLQEGVRLQRIAITPKQGWESKQEESSNAITFLPNGSANASVIVLGDEINRYMVMISAATGKATMVFGEAESEDEIVDLDE